MRRKKSKGRGEERGVEEKGGRRGRGGGEENPLATNQLTTVISNMMKKAKTLQALSIHGLLFECVMRFAPWKNVCTQYSRRFNGE